MTDEVALAMRMLEMCRDSGATMCQSICALNLAVTLVPLIATPISTTPCETSEAVAIRDELERLKIDRFQPKH